MSPCQTVSWFPPCGSKVLVKVDSVSYTAGVAGKEFVVPDLGPDRKLLQTLGVTESANHFILRDLANTGFEFIYSGMTA